MYLNGTVIIIQIALVNGASVSFSCVLNIYSTLELCATLCHYMTLREKHAKKAKIFQGGRCKDPLKLIRKLSKIHPKFSTMGPRRAQKTILNRVRPEGPPKRAPCTTEKPAPAFPAPRMEPRYPPWCHFRLLGGPQERPWGHFRLPGGPPERPKDSSQNGIHFD